MPRGYNMAAWIKNVSQVLFGGFLLFCLIVDLEVVARGGGRGGGGRGGSRGSRGGRARAGGKGKSGFSRTATRAALIAGVYYGSRSYMTRRRYSRGDFEPSICQNTKDKDSNGTVYGKFICPMESQSDDYTYCCGDESEETCCGFWDDGSRIAGVVFGIIGGIVALVTCVVLLWCFCCKDREKPERKPPANNGYTTNWTNWHHTEMARRPPATQSYDDFNMTHERLQNDSAVSDHDTAQPYTTYPSNDKGLPYPTDIPTQPVPPSYDMAIDQRRYPHVQ